MGVRLKKEVVRVMNPKVFGCTITGSSKNLWAGGFG